MTDDRYGRPGDHDATSDELADRDRLHDQVQPRPGEARPPEPSPGDVAPGSDRSAPDPVARDDADGSAPVSAGTDPMSRRARRRARAGTKRRKAPWWELPALVALAVLIAVLVKTFLVQPFYIPSESMEKTLHGCPGCSGDRILVSKVVYDFRDPEPGDIVVFNAPTGWNDEVPATPPSNPLLRAIRGFGQLVGFVPPDGLVLVKRVIAAGGQTVKGDSAGNVYVSDHGTAGPFRKLDETYVYESGTDPRAKFGPITVPKGRLWVMGDHRDRSADSRYHCGAGGGDGPDNVNCNTAAATVPDSAVIGKAVVIAWPPSRWTTLGTPATFENAAAALGGSGFLPVAVVGPLLLVLRRRRRR